MTDLKNILVSGDLYIDQHLHQITQKGQVIKLPELSYNTLLELIKNAPNTVSIEHLIKHVWNGVEVSSETVTQRIALLRKALNKNSSYPDGYITSVRSQGYRWNFEVKNPVNDKKQFSKLEVLFLIAFLFIILSIGWDFINNSQSQAKSKVNILEQDEYLSQAWVYLEKHDSKSTSIAEKLFRKSLSINPNNKSAMLGISFALSHQVTKFNQPNELLVEAKKMAEEVIKSDPQNANALVALGFVYDANGEFDQAINLYEKAINIKPNDQATKASLAYLYSQKGRLVDAMQLNLAVVDTKQPYKNLQIAHSLELLGYDSIAEFWYQKADELSPDNVFTTHQWVRFYISQDKLSRAETLAKTAIQRNIERPELHVSLGIIEWIKKDMDAALLHFKKARAIDDSDLEAQLWEFMASHKTGKSTSETHALESELMQTTISWPDFYIHQAILLAHNQKFTEAITSLNIAYNKGYLNHMWIKKLPPLIPLFDHPDFVALIEKMQNDTSQQKQKLLEAEWLPVSFLDPKNY